MKLVINNQDIAPSDFTLIQTDTTLTLDISQKALQKLLQKSKTSPTELGLKLDKDPNGLLKAKASIDIGDMSASIDQEGDIQATLKWKI